MIYRQLSTVVAVGLSACARWVIRTQHHLPGRSHKCSILWGTISTVIILSFGVYGPSVASPVSVDRQSQQPATVIDLQPFRTVQSVEINQENTTRGRLTLINLNPQVNRWYILQLSRNGRDISDEYHLENPYPESQRLNLDEGSSDILHLSHHGEVIQCPAWQLFGDSRLTAARQSRQIYAPLCNGKLYLRNPTRGYRTAIETVTEMLRDKLPGGESIIGFVKDSFYRDAFLENARTTVAPVAPAPVQTPGSPSPAAVNPRSADRLLVPADLGIKAEMATGGMLAGQWYVAKNNPGIFVSLIQPNSVAEDILQSYPKRANRLDRVESGALVYLVAFDLDLFDLGFALGTAHPGVTWSARTLTPMRVPELPGPDGIGNISPLVANGMVNPVEAARAVSTFTGGFKRSHSAFKYGNLANRNRGSHYGFIQNGVVLSTLQPGLATLLVRSDGSLEMKSWVKEDNKQLGKIIQARQNGVALIEWDSSRQQPSPGPLVPRWGPGNWSGTADSKLRSLRAGVALQQTNDKRFLIYGYFSTATPSAMARVFQAYGCRYAMHLDMNALEHTYLALYHNEGRQLLVQHLIEGMSVLDKTKNDTYIPRFLGYPDNRDFFYVMKRE